MELIINIIFVSLFAILGVLLGFAFCMLLDKFIRFLKGDRG